MTTTITPRPEIPRDAWGRPLVVPPGGGKPVPYTRCTTFVGCVEDTYNLSRWQMRMVALGLSERPDLRLAIAAHREDKTRLNELCEDALEAAKAHAAATTGTALHSFTEQMDRGQELRGVPDEYLADLAAYAAATEELTAVQIEQFTVNDPLKIGGTPDRVVRFNGKRYIADLKTGAIKYGYLKIAAQLAVYARSRPYDVVTNERLEPHGAELDRGIVIHLPAGSGECRLYWVNLLEGWEAVRVARDLRAKRSIGFKALFDPLDATTPPRVTDPGDDLRLLITAAETADVVRQLWRDHAARWTDQHTELAKLRIAELAGDPSTTTTEGAPA
jgi:hypothetical protein